MWGVELLEPAAKQAERVLDKVLIGDIADLIDQIPDGYFDLVICNDVLEHMVDPFTVLTRLRGKMSGRGVVVSSIPNIRYYHTFHEILVHGQWEYEESGALDRTHLRFFTKKSIRRMYERLGYEGVAPRGHQSDAEPAEGVSFRQRDPARQAERHEVGSVRHNRASGCHHASRGPVLAVHPSSAAAHAQPFDQEFQYNAAHRKAVVCQA